jgi:hypothetical protein
VGATSRHGMLTPPSPTCSKGKFYFNPVRIRVRIDPQYPLVCRKRRLNGAVLQIRSEKTEAPYHSRCGTIKISPCSKAFSAEHGSKFCSPSPVLAKSPCKWKILERDGKRKLINHSVFLRGNTKLATVSSYFQLMQQTMECISIILIAYQ